MKSQLEIGPGDFPAGRDWDTLDAVPGRRITYVAKWGFEPLPIPDNSYELIFSSHTIEHIPWHLTVDALREIYRILKPGGAFECWTVDFAVVVRCYLEQRRIGEWDCGGLVKHWMQSIAGRVYAYEKHGNPWMWHKALFDRPYLEECMMAAGFSVVEKLEKTRTHDHGEMNLGVKGIK